MRKVADVKMPELVEHEITIKVADRQLEILENRAKELGLNTNGLRAIYGRVVSAFRKERD
jgi:hypothetical protein